MKLMAAKKTPFVSTLTIGENYSRPRRASGVSDQPLYAASLSVTSSASMTETRRGGLPPHLDDLDEDRRRRSRKAISR